MKQYMYMFLMIGCFVLMLCFPKETFAGATSGLLLWFQIILPTLLPFIIVSNLLIYTNAFSYLSKLTKAFLQKLFHISENACYAVLVGFLCGYPMGAKVIADLIKTNSITRKEGRYLLSFCNNTSYVFIVSYIVTQNFQDKSLLLGTLGILTLSPILCSFIFRAYYRIADDYKAEHTHIHKPFHFNFQIFDHCIMNGFETITKVGGYIILFSILITLFEKLPIAWFIPTLEISNGIQMILKSSLPFTTVFVCVLSLTSFGGLCAMAQTSSMIQETKLSLFPYIIQKLITALVTSLLAYIYILFIHG